MSITYFNGVYGAFLDAERGQTSLDRFYNIANRIIRLRFAGPSLVPCISPALEHLAVAGSSTTDLTVCLWDSASTHTMAPPLPWEQDSHMASKNVQEPKENIGHTIYFKDKRITGAYQLGSSAISMLDTEQNLAIYWVPDACQIPYYESAAPLRVIIQWWAHSYGLQLVHAGAVGTPKRGILLAGKSGAGKSSTALACLNSGLAYAGDDYVLFSIDSVARVYSLYNSCKLNFSDIRRFPQFKPGVINHENRDAEKALMFLYDFLPEKVTKGFQIHAILLPRVAGATKTTLLKVSPSVGLKALGPSTIFQSPGAGMKDLYQMSRLSKQVPNYVLEIGEDINQIPEVILGLLSKD